MLEENDTTVLKYFVNYYNFEIYITSSEIYQI